MTSDEAVSMSEDCVCRTEHEARVLRTIFRRTQIDNRHLCIPHTTAYDWVPVPPRSQSPELAAESRGPTTAERMKLYAEHAAPLALRSATQAIEAATVDPSDISHCVSVSCTGFEAPGVDIQLIDRLGLRRDVERVHVGFMGCHGAINGMRVALGLTAADPAANVLMVATELCSLHFCSSWDPDRLLGNALFADGSAALVCRASPGETHDPFAWQLQATGSYLFDDSHDAITWRIGDYGFEMSLSSEVPKLIQTNLRPWLEKWLKHRDVAMTDVASWAIHPGGPRIVDAVEEGLGLTAESTSVSRKILQSHGNMSSPTILFILDELRRRNAPLPCVALGFGPGLVAEAALFG